MKNINQSIDQSIRWYFSDAFPKSSSSSKIWFCPPIFICQHQASIPPSLWRSNFPLYGACLMASIDPLWKQQWAPLVFDINYLLPSSESLTFIFEISFLRSQLPAIPRWSSSRHSAAYPRHQFQWANIFSTQKLINTGTHTFFYFPALKRILTGGVHHPNLHKRHRSI